MLESDCDTDTQRRLDEMETRVRQLTRYLAICVSGIAVLCLLIYCCAVGVFALSNLEVDRLTIVDNAGRPRIVLGVFGVYDEAEMGTPFIQFYDESARKRVELGLDRRGTRRSDSSPTLNFFTSKELPNVRLQALDESSLLFALHGHDATLALSVLSSEPEIALTGGEGNESEASFKLFPKTGSRCEVRDKEGNARFQCDLLWKGTSAITLKDKQGVDQWRAP